MRENVNYAKCVCDVCQKEEHIKPSCLLPNGWEKLTFGVVTMDLCKECIDRLENHLSSEIEKFTENKMKCTFEP